jgi:predicted ATPase
VFIDFTTLTDPEYLLSALARPFGFPLPKEDRIGAIANFLSEKQLLLILDNCEHLVAEAALLAEALHTKAPNVHLLCTSREPLRVCGEWIYRLNGLTFPPNDKLTPDEALQFSAVELFVERAVSSQEAFELNEDNVSAVCRICRRLDGIPLALELAAAGLDSFSLGEFADRVEDRFALLNNGRRTAAPRQQTLRATLDWSHGLLSDDEKVLFRRLAVFRSPFDLSSIVSVCAGPGLSTAQAEAGVGSLTAKSLLQADTSGEITYFRLLESTRAYAREQLVAADESILLNRRHADRILAILNEGADNWRDMDLDVWRAHYGRLIDDIRAAIDWALGPGNLPEIAVAITNLAGPLAFQLSLLQEFHNRYEAAYALLPALGYDPLRELHLSIGLSRFIFHCGGSHERAAALIDRALEIAKELGDAREIEATAGLFVLGLSTADYQAMQRAVVDVDRLAAKIGDQWARYFSMRMAAQEAMFAGDIQRSDDLVRTVMSEPYGQVGVSYFGQLWHDREMWLHVIRARALFLRGEFQAGLSMARDAIDYSSKLEHQQPLMITMGLCACPLANWSGDWALAKEFVALFGRHIDRYSATYYRRWSMGYETAIKLSENGADGFEPAPSYHTLLHDHLCSVHDAFVTPAAVVRAQNGRAGWATAEILRGYARKLVATGQLEEAGSVLQTAQDVARDQGNLFWQIRIGIDAATLLTSPSRVESGLRLLESICTKLDTASSVRDVRRAIQVLSERRKSTAHHISH